MWQVPCHDHRDGVCDLPLSLAAEVTSGPGDGSCRWVFVYTGVRVCCCPMCGDGDGRRRDRRAGRRRVAALCRQVVRARLDGWDVDWW